MKDWWDNQTPRERIMISLAALLAILVIGFQFGLRPLLAAREDAVRNLQRQKLETAQTLQGISQLQASTDREGGVGANAGGRSLELMLSQTAGERGLQIMRLQPSANQDVMVWFDQAEAQVLHLWMLDLEQKQGLQVQALDLRNRNDGPGLRGSITVSRRAGG